MRSIRLEGGKDYGKPVDWDDEKDGPCGSLSVVVEGSAHVSVWCPTLAEREQIRNGANIALSVIGGQPPVMLTVVQIGIETKFQPIFPMIWKGITRWFDKESANK
jgi:hypothetical protein